MLGVDDSPFSRKESKSRLVGVLMSYDFHIDGMITSRITVDGDDSSSAILSFLESGIGRAANAVFTNGITFAGFNMFDPDLIFSRSGTPVISVVRKKPDIDAMIDAIIKHHGNQKKTDFLLRLQPQEILLRSGSSIYINKAGIGEEDAAKLIERSIFRGNFPEAVRVAHMVASVIKNGKTHGRV